MFDKHKNFDKLSSLYNINGTDIPIPFFYRTKFKIYKYVLN